MIKYILNKTFQKKVFINGKLWSINYLKASFLSTIAHSTLLYLTLPDFTLLTLNAVHKQNKEIYKYQKLNKNSFVIRSTIMLFIEI